MHHNAEFIDIRQYVKFKKLPGGVRSDCKLIRGTVCTKNIAHKAMPSKIENPKILLLLGSIVYQRIEGRLMSLEPVLMQVCNCLDLILLPTYYITYRNTKVYVI